MTLQSILLVAFVITAAAVAGSVFSDHAKAATLDGYITELTVRNNYVNSNETLRVNVRFSDGLTGRSVFEGGDLIYITWPSSGDAYLKGYKTTLPLVDPYGTAYGTVQVTSSGAAIMFYDAVNNMHDVEGGSCHYT